MPIVPIYSLCSLRFFNSKPEKEENTQYAPAINFLSSWWIMCGVIKKINN